MEYETLKFELQLKTTLFSCLGISTDFIKDDTRLWRDANERDLWKADAKQTSLYFNTINRNKRSVAVDLKNAQGRDIILNLARNADVV